jgi:hypothetical protein
LLVVHYGWMSPSNSSTRTGASMAVASILSVQLGLAASVGLFDSVGPEGAACLRLAWAGLLLLVLVRPRPSQFSRSGFRASLLLGVAIAGVTLFFMASLARLPLGTAAALEFLGPLGVAVARGDGAAKVWPGLAAVGVLLLTEPWHGGADAIGVAFALAAAACWAAYILLTQRVGDEVAGITGLAVSMPVAGLISLMVGVRRRAGGPGSAGPVHAGDVGAAPADDHGVRDADEPGAGGGARDGLRRAQPDTGRAAGDRDPVRGGGGRRGGANGRARARDSARICLSPTRTGPRSSRALVLLGRSQKAPQERPGPAPATGTAE